MFFCKTIYSFHKGAQKIQQTNHYILLANVSIKRCIRLSSEPGSSGGGEEFQPDKYLTGINLCYPSHDYNILDFATE